MQTYGFDSNTKEFTGVSTADRSPLEPGVYLYPAHTTTAPPPKTGKNEAAVWGGDDWQVVDDWRGEAGWVNGEWFTVKDLGPLPDGWGAAPPEQEQASPPENTQDPMALMQQAIMELSEMVMELLPSTQPAGDSALSLLAVQGVERGTISPEGVPQRLRLQPED